MTKTNELRREEVCCTAEGNENEIVKMTNCYNNDKKQKWRHAKNGAIEHMYSSLCIDLTGSPNGGYLKLQKCNEDIPGQQWTFSNYY